MESLIFTFLSTCYCPMKPNVNCIYSWDGQTVCHKQKSAPTNQMVCVQGRYKFDNTQNNCSSSSNATVWSTCSRVENVEARPLDALEDHSAIRMDDARVQREPITREDIVDLVSPEVHISSNHFTKENWYLLPLVLVLVSPGSRETTKFAVLLCCFSRIQQYILMSWFLMFYQHR